MAMLIKFKKPVKAPVESVQAANLNSATHVAAIPEKPAHGLADKLTELVKDQLKLSTYEHQGQEWAARPQAWYCERLGVSTATLRRAASAPAFVRCVTQDDDGNPLWLIRLATGNENIGERNVIRHPGAIIASRWRQATGRRPGNRDFGCICELAKLYPVDPLWQMLDYVRKDWQTFMGAVKAEIDLAIERGETGFRYRYYEYPSLPVILRFRAVAAECYVTHLQETGAVAP